MSLLPVILNVNQPITKQEIAKRKKDKHAIAVAEMHEFNKQKLIHFINLQLECAKEKEILIWCVHVDGAVLLTDDEIKYYTQLYKISAWDVSVTENYGYKYFKFKL